MEPDRDPDLAIAVWSSSGSLPSVLAIESELTKPEIARALRLIADVVERGEGGGGVVRISPN